MRLEMACSKFTGFVRILSEGVLLAIVTVDFSGRGPRVLLLTAIFTVEAAKSAGVCPEKRGVRIDLIRTQIEIVPVVLTRERGKVFDQG
jgi:hypothetical protein